MNLTNAQKEVIRKIIYAVETGGQVYGKQDYTSLIGAGTNTSNEVAITIGAGQWYATEAKTLLNLIRSTDKATFNKLDTTGIGTDLDSKNWSTYNLSVSSAKAKCIVAIISSAIGIKCQDSLMESQITTYSESIQKTYGSMSADAIAECINIKHQGGDGALKRILAKTDKPYTAKSIYAALNTDPLDKSNNNQVGDYESRQKKVYSMITTYLIPLNTSTGSTNTTTGGTKMTENELRAKVVSIAESYLHYNESNGSHRTIIDGYNAVKPLPRSYAVTYNDAWCATFVSFVSIKAGLTDIMPRECGCGAMIELYQKLGRWVENDAYVPKAGDIIMYDWDDNGVGDCTGYPEHVGIVVSVSGSSIKIIEGNKSDSVEYRTITVNARYIRGYCIPNYASKTTSSNSSTPSTPSTPTANTPSTSGTTLNRTAQWTGYVTADELNVRTWAGTENKTCSFSPLKKDAEVEVCDSQKASNGAIWYYIKYNGKYGFVHSSYVQKKIAASTTPSTSTPTVSVKVDYAQSCSKSLSGTYKTTAALNLRAGAGTNKSVICVIPQGDKVTNYGFYTDVNGTKWYFVAYKTYTGFVSSKYLQKV